MKKFSAVFLSLILLFAFAACGQERDERSLYEKFMDAEAGESVEIDAFISAKSFYRDSSVRLMLQDERGGYHVYNMPCSEDEYDQLAVGQEIAVSGTKEIYKGEPELQDGSFEINKLKATVKPTDISKELGTDNLFNFVNMFISVRDANLSTEAIFGKDGSGDDGDELFFIISVGGKEYQAKISTDFTEPGSDVYEAVKGLSVDDTFSLEGFLFWQEDEPLLYVTKVVQ